MIARGAAEAMPGLARARLRRLAGRPNLELLLELTRAEVKVADHNSILGAAWSLLAPFVMLVALWAVFQRRFGAEVRAYPVYLLIGISLVNYFVNTTRDLTTVLFQNRILLLNSTVPRETVIAAQVVVHSYKLVAEMALCAAFSAWYGIFSPGTVLATLPLLIAFVALTTGVGLVLALVHSFARDIGHVWAMSSRLLLFVTPVFYTLDGLGPLARFFVAWLNPLTPFLMAMRAALMSGRPFSLLVYGYALALGAGAMTLGYAAFLRLEHMALERT